MGAHGPAALGVLAKPIGPCSHPGTHKIAFLLSYQGTHLGQVTPMIAPHIKILLCATHWVHARMVFPGKQDLIHPNTLRIHGSVENLPQC
jgi:hypothetical protein